MMEDLVLREQRGRVGIIQLNSPKTMNALSPSIIEAVMNALEAFDRDDSVGAIVLTGHARAFSVGADVKQFESITAEEIRRQDPIGKWDRMHTIRKPMIAAVSGYALGGGCEIALACDLIIASATAVFGQPEVNLGIMPGAGATQRLPHLVGAGIAMEMILNDRRLSAEEALQYGLANHVFSVEDYLERAIDLAQSIAEKAPRAVQDAKQLIRAAQDLPLTEGLKYERERFYGLFSGPDATEGVAAFLEKRAPEWQEY